MTSNEALLAAAVADNLRWCATVGATAATADHSGVWVAPPAPHPLFPDLVTTRPGVSAAGVAARLEGRARCSVKDSFADLDLTGHGFTVLFDAEWIGLSPSAQVPEAPLPDWSVVSSTAGLERWSGFAGLPVPLPAHVIADPAITVLAGGDGDVHGLVVTATQQTIGVSNVHGAGDVWPSVVAGLRARFPGHAIVGYESGADLRRALDAGFRSLGRLRVWTREA